MPRDRDCRVATSAAADGLPEGQPAPEPAGARRAGARRPAAPPRRAATGPTGNGIDRRHREADRDAARDGADQAPGRPVLRQDADEGGRGRRRPGRRPEERRRSRHQGRLRPLRAARRRRDARPERLHVPPARPGDRARARRCRSRTATRRCTTSTATRARRRCSTRRRSRAWRRSSSKLTDADQVVKFKCDVHPWMTGVRAGVQPPVLRGHGRRRQLQDHAACRPASYTVEAWHERYGTKTAEITVAADKPVEARVPVRSEIATPADTKRRPDAVSAINAPALLQPRVVHRFAVATAVATYLLILIGGLVHGTGSSLACPDWPTCYGTLMPKMEGGVLVEHSHRLAAGTVVDPDAGAGGHVDGASKRPGAAAAAAVRLAGGRPGVRAGAAGRHHRHAAAADAGLDGAHGDVAAVLPDGALRRRPFAAARRPSRAPVAAADRSRGWRWWRRSPSTSRWCWAVWSATRARRSPARTCRCAAVRCGPTRTRPC